MRHCVITGAADGIGRALAHQFARAGYSITGIDIDPDRAAQTCRELTAGGSSAAFIVADLTSPAEIDRTLAQLVQGPDIDLLIHNAGINAVGRFGDLPLTAQQQVIALNLTAPQLLTAGLLQQRKVSAGGSLVFVSSLSHYVGYPGAAVYAAGKDGLASYARSLTVSLAGQDIHVLTVFPGPTRTAHARRYSPDNSREHQRMPPEDLATQVFSAVQRHRRVLIPGEGNQLFALVGRLWPALAHRVMQKLILDKLTPAD